MLETAVTTLITGVVQVWTDSCTFMGKEILNPSQLILLNQHKLQYQLIISSKVGNKTVKSLVTKGEHYILTILHVCHVFFQKIWKNNNKCDSKYFTVLNLYGLLALHKLNWLQILKLCKQVHQMFNFLFSQNCKERWDKRERIFLQSSRKCQHCLCPWERFLPSIVKGLKITLARVLAC